MSINHQRFEVLDGIRGVAALAVMIHHFTQHTYAHLFPGANLAVDLFFCLSGFVIAYSYLNRLAEDMSVWEFVKKRLIRLYPMFFLGGAIGSVALVMKFFTGQTDFPARSVGHAILVNMAYIPFFSEFFIQVGKDKISGAVFPINDPAWSLFFEFVANIIFALAAVAVVRLSCLNKMFVGATMLGALGLIVWMAVTKGNAPGWSSSNFIGGFPRVVFGFFSGLVVYWVFRSFDFRLRIPALSLLLLVILIFLSANRIFWLFCTIVLCPIIVLFGATSQLRSNSSRKAFEYLGWISYPLYCVHFPIFSMYTIFSENKDYGTVGLIGCIGTTWLVAHCLAKFVEEPVRSLLANKIKQRTSST